MMRNTIPAREVFAEWRKDPEFMREYDALEDEFALASQIIGARAHANISQAELAERMNTSQSAIARLESGRFRPSTRTLEKLAEATGMKLRIVLEPLKAR
jgi:ribosome-binding protein aMBF1 (putative translation factor)